MKQTKKLREEILAKKELLDQARTQLKKEFIGIDQVIDEVIDSVSSWFMFPEMQDKPVIVNLWGMTGVGKSSLIDRLAILLKYESKYFRFDLGEDGDNQSLKSKMAKMYVRDNGIPFMFAFDEFQHARTMNETDEEVNNPYSRIIWEVMDSGKFQYTCYPYHLNVVYELKYMIEHFISKGMRTSGGVVISHKDQYLKGIGFGNLPTFNEPEDQTHPGELPIVPVDCYEFIYEISSDIYKSPFEIREKLMQLNGRETVDFLNMVIDQAKTPKTLDFSKAIIFVIGNLDEAYNMSRNYNPDMSADEFHELSLKIDVPKIKSALQSRFRNEQVSRMGNTHIIYPAFNCDTFRKIIDLELNRTSSKLNEQHNIILEFDDTIKEIIYKEGVFPTQGTRPVFTTIHNIIKTRLAKVISEMIIQRLNADIVRFSFYDSKVVMNYIQKGRSIHTIEEVQILKLQKLRVCKKDDVQAITAVHESGHAVLSSILLLTVPDMILSNTVENGTSGFSYIKPKWEYVSKKEILNRLAMILGGYAAERIVFGVENITTGADEDIEKATFLITDMLKRCGMGNLPGAYHVKSAHTRHNLHDESGRIDSEAEEWLSSALTLAEKTLREQEDLLLKMGDYLSDNRCLQKNQIKEMLEKHSRNFDVNDLIEDGSLLFYRKHLKNKLKSFDEPKEEQIKADMNGFSLNKKS